jgi:L-histidine Nalpha-methyltransferase
LQLWPTAGEVFTRSKPWWLEIDQGLVAQQAENLKQYEDAELNVTTIDPQSEDQNPLSTFQPRSALNANRSIAGDSTTPSREPSFLQLHNESQQSVRAELIGGLCAPAATVAPKFLYDPLGSRLFDAITELDEYYPTRTEAAIFREHGPSMAEAAGPIGTLIDLGAGNCSKALGLMPLLRPRKYLAIDISVEFLRQSLAQVQRAHPTLEVAGLGLDFSSRLDLPAGLVQGRPVFFYPGSSIGNFSPEEAASFLRGVHANAGGGGLLIGVDLVKDAAVLEAAYDDALGVTGAFNLNLLLHVNRLIGSNFQPRDWRHLALYNTHSARIEMHLEARRAVTVAWPGGERRFVNGERIHTENSCKYSVSRFQALLRDAGFRAVQHWQDHQGWFAVFWAEA